jgi:hypothetical protein
MTYGRVLCQVVETPAQDYHDEWMPVEQDWPRDLLPWADPYIAVLMLRLERRYEWAGVADDSSLWADDLPPGAASESWQDLSWQDDSFADGVFAGNPWHDDACLPGRQAGRRSMFPPIIGGFPLLDDVTDGLEEDPV